jgi:hypothetical protein
MPSAAARYFWTWPAQGHKGHKPGMSFGMLRQEVDGDTAYIVWKAETADNRFELGSDTFILQDGKIVPQTFAEEDLAAALSSSVRMLPFSCWVPG